MGGLLYTDPNRIYFRSAGHMVNCCKVVVNEGWSRRARNSIPILTAACLNEYNRTEALSVPAFLDRLYEAVDTAVKEARAGSVTAPSDSVSAPPVQGVLSLLVNLLNHKSWVRHICEKRDGAQPFIISMGHPTMTVRAAALGCVGKITDFSFGRRSAESDPGIGFVQMLTSLMIARPDVTGARAQANEASTAAAAQIAAGNAPADLQDALAVDADAAAAQQQMEVSATASSTFMNMSKSPQFRRWVANPPQPTAEATNIISRLRIATSGASDTGVSVAAGTPQSAVAALLTFLRRKLASKNALETSDGAAAMPKVVKDMLAEFGAIEDPQGIYNGNNGAASFMEELGFSSNRPTALIAQANAIGTLANCCMDASVCDLFYSLRGVEVVAPFLLDTADLSFRAAALLARVTAAVEPSRASLRKTESIPVLLRHLKIGLEEVAKVWRKKNAAGLKLISSKANAHAIPPKGASKGDDGVQLADEEDDGLSDQPEDLVAACLRCVTACSKDKENRDAIREEGGIPTLIGFLASSDETTLANTALCLGECAWSAANIPFIKPAARALIEILKNRSSDISAQNAAICLARIAKDEDTLQLLRDNQAIEIMHHVLGDMQRRKDKSAK